MSQDLTWHLACRQEDVDLEDVLGVTIAGSRVAIYRSPDDKFYATEGLCTHEQVKLEDGLVMDDIIECPKHNGRFNYRTGEAKGAPACINLRTLPVKLDGDAVYVGVAHAG